MQNLIFSFMLLGCERPAYKQDSITIFWERGRAMGIVVPLRFLEHTVEDSIEYLLQIHLVNSNVRSPILGEYTTGKDAVLFRPLIPLTPGLKYEVRLRNKSLGKIEVPGDISNIAPVVISVYPTADTLPQNLLKLYIQFSKSMNEGEAMQRVMLIKNNNDTVHFPFLDLQHELWSNDRTMLTLWLDPGRIKRDLQPNKTLGAPLEPANRYQLVILPDWKDSYGTSLATGYRKDFVTGFRDSTSPHPDSWTIQQPESGTTQPLNVYFHESLDYVLLKKTVRVIDDNGNVVAGNLNVTNEERMISFSPFDKWNAGRYTVEFESRLEDLAGNNLNRLFERDVTDEKSDDQKVFKKIIQVK